MKKVIRLTESDLTRLIKKILSEQPLKKVLGPERLSSPAGQENKKHSEFFNKYYKLNLPLDGNWLNPEFSKVMGRYLKEKNIPIWVCKKGDGYCSNDGEDDGVITTKEIKRLRDSIAQDSAKLQVAKINTPLDSGITLCSEIGVKTIGFCDKNKKVVRFGPCSKLGVKYSGMCEYKTKRPVESCAKLGVKANAICYVDTKEVVERTNK